MSLNYMIKNLKGFVQTKGLHAIIKKVKSTYSQIDVIGYYGYTLNNQEIPYNESDEKAAGGQYVVNWIIPDLDVGSGGHMNIFRFISFWKTWDCITEFTCLRVKVSKMMKALKNF